MSVVNIPLTVHQVWLGDELPKEEKNCIETTFTACDRLGYTYKLWNLNDIIHAFPHDEIFYRWNKLWTVIPYPAIFAATVDYYKWKILEQTPEEERAVYMDIDAEIRHTPQVIRNIPLPQTHVSFGAGADSLTLSTAYIQVFGPQVAKLAVIEAEKKLQQFDPDSRDFFSEFFASCANGQRNHELSLGSEWVRDSLIPVLEKSDLSAEIAPIDTFCQFGQHDNPIILHHERHYLTEKHKTPEEIDIYIQETTAKVKRSVEDYNSNRQRVITFMSTAREYDNLERTLGIIKAKDIRDIQRKTTFATAANYQQLDYYFVVGKSETELDQEEKDSPEFFYAETPEDTKDTKYQAQRFYDAIKWVTKKGGFDFLFFCEDDNYIHLSRLFSYCANKQPGECVVIGNPDPEGNYIHAGIMISVAMARRILLQECDPPKPNEEFGSWLRHCLDVVGGTFVADEKFSFNKGQYPAFNNGRITTHNVNPFDLVQLAAMNEDRKN